MYEQVNQMSGFAPRILLTLKKYDLAATPSEENEAIEALNSIKKEFKILRENFETVYAKTRILQKSPDYILDQDHHVHLANQSLDFGWQFLAEELFLEKLEQNLENIIHLDNTNRLKD